MAWTTPRTWSVGELLTAANFNTYIRDEFNWLFGRPYAVTVYKAAADYTRTSSTFANVDATNVSLTISTAAARLLCVASFCGFDAAGTGAYFDIAVDGTRIGDTTYGLGRGINSNTQMCILGVSSVLSVGSHTVRLQYAHSAAGTAEVKAHTPITLFALEING